MGIGKRIKEIRKVTNITQQTLADKIGLKRNTIANYEIEQITPSDRTIADICREFNVCEEWLRNGTGEMFLKIDQEQELQDVFSQISISNDDLIKRIIKSYWGLNEKEKAVIRKLIDGFIEK